MRLEKWALVAEIIGRTAIVASLAFVGIRIMQGTSLAKANSYQSLLEQVGSWRCQVVADPELYRLFDIPTSV